jgi:hypothetical protein
MGILKSNYLSLRHVFIYKLLRLKEPKVPEGYHQHGYHYHNDIKLPESGVSRDLAISGYQLLGSLTPFYKMAKDVANTFKPYSRGDQMLRDASGIDIAYNGLLGATNLAVGAITLAVWLIAAPFALAGCFLPTKYKSDCQQFFTRYLSYPVSWIIEGAGKSFRAFTQLLATPLAVTIKFPLRAILRCVAMYKGEKFLAEEKKSIQDLAKKANKKLEELEGLAAMPKTSTTEYKIKHSLHILLKALHNKYEHAKGKGWNTSIYRQEFTRYDSAVSINGVRNYLNLFTAKKEEKNKNKVREFSTLPTVPTVKKF